MRAILRQFRFAYASVFYRGDTLYCPVCDHTSSRFKPFGSTNRVNAQCPWCGAVERHRAVWHFFREHTDLMNGAKGRRMLHVAPEKCMRDELKKIVGDGYLTADLYAKGVDVAMDITNIEFPDATFDIIYCSHVLEHIDDDRKAMRELLRVLKPGGWAVILVPITAEVTFEDPSVTDPQERLRVFGQIDHVRIYGNDFVDRLLESGFDVETYTKKDLVGDDQIKRMALNTRDDIFFCRHPSSS